MTESPRSKITAEQLRVRLVAEADLPLLATFACGEPDLDDFLRSDALRLQAHRVVRTYLAFHETVLVGYMALLADAVVLETKERKRLALGSHDHPIVPALKIARLAVHWIRAGQSRREGEVFSTRRQGPRAAALAGAHHSA
jgi:hypothetical protein